MGNLNIWKFQDYFTSMGATMDEETIRKVEMYTNISDQDVILSQTQRLLMAAQNKCIAIVVAIAVAVLALLIIGCTIAILRSQRKTRKLLQELTEAQKKSEPEQEAEG